MNNEEVAEEVGRLLVEDEMVKNVAAILHSTTLCGLAVANNALMPYLQEKYDTADVLKIGMGVVATMQHETKATDELELGKLIALMESNVKFLKKLEEGNYE
jgi:hypothetical protein